MHRVIISIFSIIYFFNLSLFAKCESELFNIGVEDTLTIADILNQVSMECEFSVVVKDSIAQTLIDTPITNLNLKNVTLLELFDNLLKERNLEYELTNKLLKIKYLITRTFKIDYVATYREGKSNTDVTISTSGSTTNSNGNSNSNSNSNSGSDSSTSKTGTVIDSTDKFDFWESLEKDITYLLNSTYSMVKGIDLKPLVSKEAGLITVTGNTEQMTKIEQYIMKLQKRLQNQVLIDVKILSVELSKERKVGIDWNNFLSSLALEYSSTQGGQKNKTATSSSDSAMSVSMPSNPLSVSNAITTGISDGFDHFGSNTFGIGGAISLTNIVNVLKENGDVKSISNPKILTLNNQPALISSGDDLFYKLQTRIINSNDSSTNDSSSDSIKSIFAGVLLDITPPISDDDEIILKINPSITQLRSPSDLKSDNSDRNMPPDLTKRQISTVIKVKNGDKAIIGGLITSNEQFNERKVPLLGDIPFVGNAFKSVDKVSNISELVIIITPVIVKNDKTLSLKDLNYKKATIE